MVRHPGICFGIAIIARDGACDYPCIANRRQKFVHSAAADAAFEPNVRVAAKKRYADHPLISSDITHTDSNSKVVDTMQRGPGSAGIDAKIRKAKGASLVLCSESGGAALQSSVDQVVLFAQAAPCMAEQPL